LHALEPAWQDMAQRQFRLATRQPAQAPLTAQPSASSQPAAGSAVVHGTEAREEVQRYLSALESAFRGDTKALSRQLEVDYLKYLLPMRDTANGARCLDLGCGRGTWMRLLRAEGFATRGVDMSKSALQEAIAHGLDVEQADAVQWLGLQPDGSALAITAFHVMEHLQLEQRLALLREAVRVLRPGGLLILETPNPENIYVATHTFHHDPTHTQPLTPVGLAFMVSYHGLQVLEVPRLHPYPPEAAVPGDDATTQRLNGLTCIGQDFAVVARKPLAGDAQPR